MITIDFLISPSWRSKHADDQLQSADGATLRYDVLLGDVIFRTDECDFSARWDWVPLIDFVASLRQMMDELIEKDNSKTVFDFTESDATLEFKRESSTVIISPSYVKCHAIVPLVDLARAVDSVSRRLVETISREFPLLLLNKTLPSLLPIPLTTDRPTTEK